MSSLFCFFEKKAERKFKNWNSNFFQHFVEKKGRRGPKKAIGKGKKESSKIQISLDIFEKKQALLFRLDSHGSVCGVWCRRSYTVTKCMTQWRWWPNVKIKILLIAVWVCTVREMRSTDRGHSHNNRKFKRKNTTTTTTTIRIRIKEHQFVCVSAVHMRSTSSSNWNRDWRQPNEAGAGRTTYGTERWQFCSLFLFFFSNCRFSERDLWWMWNK